MVSFRLGGRDGVAVEAAKWEGSLERLGWSVRRVAGAIEDRGRAGDVVLPGLALPDDGTTAPAPDRAAVAAALARADLVLVENLLSLPLNLPAAEVVSDVLAETRLPVVLHHHDLPWQRARTAHVHGFPPDLHGARHVTINDLSRRELAARRGIEAVTIRNCFDTDAPPGDRTRGRAVIGAARDDIVVLHPVRAIERKNVPAALQLCEQLAERLTPRLVRYWLPGPAEEGYGPTLAAVLDTATNVKVHREPAPAIADAYAAADVVAFPSTWEGFGNPVVESVIARRPLVAGHYPALDELVGEGFRFLGTDDPDGVARAVIEPDPTIVEHNLTIAHRHHSLAALDEQLGALLAEQQP